MILAGHTRYKALKKLGYQECEVVIVSDLTEAQKKKYRLYDNKTAEMASWDQRKLSAELCDVDFQDMISDSLRSHFLMKKRKRQALRR